MAATPGPRASSSATLRRVNAVSGDLNPEASTWNLELETWNYPRAGWGTADLHAHSCHDLWGDGNQTVAELLHHVQEHTTLDVFAITDHDSTDAAREARALHARGGYRFDFLPGVEVTNTAGHLLCYFPDEIFDVPSLRPFWWTVRYVRERGGICVAAHPIYPPWLAGTLRRHLGRDGFELDGVEVINAGLPARAWARLTALGDQLDGRVALVGNSDAHHALAIGSASTAFPGHSIADYLAALRAGTTRPLHGHTPSIPRAAQRFTQRRSLTRPGWVRNIYREVAGTTRGR